MELLEEIAFGFAVDKYVEVTLIKVEESVGRNHKPAAGISVIALCAITLMGCQTPQQIVEQKEDSLSAAGFVMRPANNPQRQEMLNRLPPHHFVKEVHGDLVNYVYADPLVCNCLYVGSQQAYGRYRQYLQQKRIADEQEMTAQMYSDSAWDWGAWGPWAPGYGFGYGPGIGW